MEEKPPTTPIKKKFNFKSIAIYLLIILVSAGATYGALAKKANVRCPTIKDTTEKPDGSAFDMFGGDEEDTQETWVPLTSSEKAFPYVDRESRVLKLWSLKDKAVKDTELKVNWGGGAAGLGNTDPLASPDSMYTAFESNEDGSLWLLSNETLEKKQISPEGVDVTYITDWSSDGKYIVYYVKGDSFLYDGMGQYEGIVQFEENEYSGFLAFNTVTGETKRLSPVTYVETTMGETKLLVRTREQGEQLITFDIETMEGDFDALQNSYGSMTALQFDFSPDAKNWTYTYSKNPTDDANIVYGKFPQDLDEMTIVDSGEWAEVQWPKISPDGKKLMYQKRDGYKFPGMPKNMIHIVNLETKANKEIAEGGHAGWIDNKHIVVTRTVREKSPSADTLIIDLETMEEYKIGTEF